MTEWGLHDEESFLDSTRTRAQAVLAAKEPWDVYAAASSMTDAASAAMSSGPLEEGYLPALPSTFYLIWARLTDEMDAPGAGETSEDHAQAVGRMKQAASEWLTDVSSPAGRAKYLARWATEAD